MFLVTFAVRLITHMKKTLILLLALVWAFPTFACTTVIVSAGASETGRPILWKQRDNKYKNSVCYNNEGRYAFTGITNLPKAGFPDARHIAAGVNEVGFAIVRNTCLSMFREDQDNSRYVSVLFMALSECETVDDFEELIKSIPTPRPFGSNFGIIDAKGGAAYFEVGDYDYNRYDVPENSYLVRTNFALKPVSEPLKSSVHRYNQAYAHLEAHEGKFSSEWMMQTLARSFYSSYMDADMFEAAPGGRAYDSDFICRNTSISCVSIEGVGPGDKLNSSVMWTIGGYPACSYAIPVWVAAGEDVPKCLKANEEKSCEVFELSKQLKAYVHPEYPDYIDFKRLKPILLSALAAEKTEFAEGRKVDDAIRKSFNSALVKKYNARADARFVSWFERWSLVK